MKNRKLFYQEKSQSIWMGAIVLQLVITIVLGNKDLDTCFGDNDYSCEKNRGIIEGEYYPCKVLKRFSTIPKSIFFHNGQLYVKLNDSVYSYDEENSEIVISDFKIPRQWRTIQLGEKVFTGGAGKATVQLSADEDDLNIVTTGEITFDVIDVYKDTIFILSFNFNKSKRDKSGSLYVLNSNRLHSDANVIIAEKVEVFEEKHIGMAIDSNKAQLFLIGEDNIGAKLIAISLEKGDSCIEAKSYNKNELDNLVNEPKNEETLLKAVTSLTDVLNKFITYNISKDCLPKSNTLLYENKSLKKQVENLERQLLVFKSNSLTYSRPVYGSSQGGQSSNSFSSGGSFGSGISGSGYSGGYGGGSGGGYSGYPASGNSYYGNDGSFNTDFTGGISDSSPYLPPLLAQLLQYPILILPIQSQLYHINNKMLQLQRQFKSLESDYFSCQQNADFLSSQLNYYRIITPSTPILDNEDNYNTTMYNNH